MKPTIIAALLAATLASCGKKTTRAEIETSSASPEIEAVFVSNITDEASPIHLVRTTVQPGDSVTIKGQIMGAMEPFVEGRAAFILGDREKLTPCNEMDDDHCSTPWDTCCEGKEDLRVGTATIQIVGENQRVLKEGLEGVEGLEKLSKIVVKGRVAEQSSKDSLVINASAIQVVE